MTCPTCSGVPGGCATCEGSGVVPVAVDREVTFAQACELVYARQVTGQPFHFLHGKPKLVMVNGVRLRIAS